MRLNQEFLDENYFEIQKTIYYSEDILPESIILNSPEFTDEEWEIWHSFPLPSEEIQEAKKLKAMDRRGYMVNLHRAIKDRKKLDYAVNEYRIKELKSLSLKYPQFKNILIE